MNLLEILSVEAVKTAILTDLKRKGEQELTAWLWGWIIAKSQSLGDKLNNETLKNKERIGALNQKALIDEFLIDLQTFLRSEND